MRKILIPTDFSVNSLKLAEHVFQLYPDEIINFLFVYPYRLPLSDSELYWFSPSKIMAEHKSDEFSKSKDEFVNKFFQNIYSIEMDLFTGINSHAFNNFIDHHKVQTAVVPQNGYLNFSDNSSFDPLGLIKKNVTKVHIVNMKIEDESKQYAIKQGSVFLSFLKKAK